jgi:hypothetical protein
MKNSKFTFVFLNTIDAQTKDLILSNVANHYGITNEQAYNELIDEDAESLLDYVTGDLRAGVSVLVQRFKLKFA